VVDDGILTHQIAGLRVLLRITEISVWAFFYLGKGCLPNGETAFYFSGTTYTSVGYGYLVLSKP